MFAQTHQYPSINTSLSADDGEYVSIERFSGGDFTYTDGVTGTPVKSVVEVSRWGYEDEETGARRSDDPSIEIDGIDGTIDAENARRLGTLLLELADVLEAMTAS